MCPVTIPDDVISSDNGVSLKTFASKDNEVVVGPINVTDVSKLQYLKALVPIESSEVGNSTDSSEPQLLKAKLPIDSSEVGNSTDVSEVQ